MNKYLIGIPLIVLADILLLSPVTWLLRQASDMHVFFGAVLLCLLLSANILLIKFIYSKLKQ